MIKISEETYSLINILICSLKEWKAYWSLNDSNKIYIFQELDIKELHSINLKKFQNNSVTYMIDFAKVELVI